MPTPTPTPANSLADSIVDFLRGCPWPQRLLDIADALGSRSACDVDLTADALRELVARGAVTIVPENGVSFYELAKRESVSTAAGALVDRITRQMAQEDAGAAMACNDHDGLG
jgi:hypothetical protein